MADRKRTAWLTKVRAHQETNSPLVITDGDLGELADLLTPPASAGMEAGEPALWLVKDFADDWFVVRSKEQADTFASEGHAIRPLYDASALATARSEGAREMRTTLDAINRLTSPGENRTFDQMIRDTAYANDLVRGLLGRALPTSPSEEA